MPPLSTRSSRAAHPPVCSSRERGCRAFLSSRPDGVEPSGRAAARRKRPARGRADCRPPDADARAGRAAGRRRRLRSHRPPCRSRVRGGLFGCLPGVAGRDRSARRASSSSSGTCPVIRRSGGRCTGPATEQRPRLALAPRQIHALPYLDLNEASRRGALEAYPDRSFPVARQASPLAGASLPFPDRDAPGARRSDGRVRVARPTPSRALARPRSGIRAGQRSRHADSIGM